MHIDKDFQDKRKSCDISTGLSETDVNLERNHIEETVNNVNNCKNSAFSWNGDCNEEHLNEIDNNKSDCVTQNRSVPTDISIHNLQCLNKGSDEISSVNYSNSWVNVPCSNKPSLEDIKNNYQEEKCGTANAYNMINEDDIAKTPLDSNIVPTETNIEEGIPKEEALEGHVKELCLNEAPPDLHVIDDSKVQVEDFRYYDVYDEHCLDDNDHDMFDNNTHNEIKAFCESNEIGVKNVSKSEEKIDDVTLEIQNHSQDVSTDNHENIKDEANNVAIEYLETGLEDLSIGADDYPLPVTSEEDIANKSSQFSNQDVIDEKSCVEDKQEKVENINCFDNSELEVVEYLQEGFNNEDNTSVGDDDFSKFTDVGSTEEKLQQNPTPKNKLLSDEVDSFYDFGKFDVGNNPIQVPTIENTNVNLYEVQESACSSKDCVGFANFDDITPLTNDSMHTEPTVSGLQGVNCSNQISSMPDLNDDEDEFGDFGNYTQSSSNDPLALANVQTAVNSTSAINTDQVLENIDNILLEMFPSCGSNYDNFVLSDISETDLVFKNIKDVTETNALTYQWSNSVSQDHLLKALNIDTRNIVSI